MYQNLLKRVNTHKNLVLLVFKYLFIRAVVTIYGRFLVLRNLSFYLPKLIFFVFLIIISIPLFLF